MKWPLPLSVSSSTVTAGTKSSPKLMQTILNQPQKATEFKEIFQVWRQSYINYNLRIVLKQLFDHLCWMVTIIQNSFLNYKYNHNHKILSNNRILHCMSWQKLYYNMIHCFIISDLELIRSENWDTLQKILFFKIVMLHLYGYNTTRTLIGIFKRKEI